MKNLFTILTVAVVLLSTACKKDNESEAAADNNWTLNGTTYKTAFSTRTSVTAADPRTLFIFADAIPQGSNPQINTLNFSFKTAPSASGTYQLVGAVGGNLTATQFELTVGGPSAVYAYIGENVNIDVKVSGGKITVTIPEITVSRAQNGSIVTAKLKASVSEIQL